MSALEQARQYSERDINLGVPLVESVKHLMPDEREKLTIETVGFLALLPREEVVVAGERVISLYSRSATVLAEFKALEVDVFAQAAVEVLESFDDEEASGHVRKILQARKIVMAQRHWHAGPLKTRKQ